MVLQSIILSLSLIFSSASPTNAAPDQEIPGILKLRDAGMSETSINGLKTLNREFREGFPRVAGSQRTIDRFLADFQLGTRLFVESMPRRDREIYEEHGSSLSDN